MSLKTREENILLDFGLFKSWEEKYEYIIDMGRSLPDLNIKYKVDENLIRGCQAKVWLLCHFKKNKLYIQGDSDAIITKGLLGLLIAVFDKCNPKEIVNSDYSFLERLGLNKHLSITRANGINEMLKVIRYYCKKHLKK